MDDGHQYESCANVAFMKHMDGVRELLQDGHNADRLDRMRMGLW